MRQLRPSTVDEVSAGIGCRHRQFLLMLPLLLSLSGMAVPLWGPRAAWVLLHLFPSDKRQHSGTANPPPLGPLLSMTCESGPHVALVWVRWTRRQAGRQAFCSPMPCHDVSFQVQLTSGIVIQFGSNC